MGTCAPDTANRFTVKGNISASGAVCSPHVCGITTICAPVVCGTTCIHSDVHKTSYSCLDGYYVCAPYVCSSTCIVGPQICAGTCIYSSGKICAPYDFVCGYEGCFGTIYKSSGSFHIDHPLESKKDTHKLVHSFVEAPQADNIYSGSIKLSSGSATVNIDNCAGMTEGTFVALNRCVRAFTTNETNWDPVKGAVSGNILTVESCVSDSTADVSWMVIGERQDAHMYDPKNNLTNSEGQVIVEPEIPALSGG